MAKLLIIDDDSNLRESLSDFLTFQHHQVESAKDCREANDRLAVSMFDLLIVDWELPDGTGVDLIREFRSAGGKAPIIMLTGKNKIDDKGLGFGAGSDDYLTKPFNFAELLMRINALLRRPSGLVSSTLKAGNIVLDPDSYRVTKNGEDIYLLPKEFALLQFFMRNSNHVFSAEALLERVWQSDTESSPRAVVACIRRLRGKIDDNDEKPLIKTIFGVGYKLEP